MLDIDFEGTNIQGTGSATNTNSDEPVKQDDVTSLDGNDVDDITNGSGNNDDTTSTAKTTTKDKSDDDNSSTGELVKGDQIEVDGTLYTVDDKGNLVDDKGNIFKEAKELNDWLKSVNVEENKESSINLAEIQEHLGVTITDENGNLVTFADTPEGLNSYVESVIELKSKDIQEAAINRLYADNPLLKQFQDYVQINGTPRGFGDIPDRSGIKLDRDNEQQLAAVIKMAAREFGNKSISDSYIKYLRDSGGLYDEARAQLNALVEKDKNYRKAIEEEAARQRQAEAANVKAYWENVNKMINSRVISGYKIPESFTKEINGKKMVVTPNDFFNYVSNAAVTTEDGNRITAYQRDLANLSDEDYLAREMLDAWLMFTGGTYKDLIDMAVKEDTVRKLVVKSKQTRGAKTVKVVKQQTGKTTIDDIIL